MSRYLKLIWFFEGDWTKYHAAVGIRAEKTLCGITRSTRPILPSEKCKSNMPRHKCFKCICILKAKYGTEDVVEVKKET